jgi:tetratricopeptide (TPR) repeat protein
MPQGPVPVKFELLSKPPWGGIYADWKLRLFTMADIAGGYFRDLVFPIRLNGDYNPPVIRTFAGALPGFAAAALAGLAAFASRRKAPLAAFGILFILAALLPVMNIVPIYNIKADRYLYLPLAGFALIAAAGAAFARDRKAGKAVFAGLMLYVIALGGLTAARNPVFRNDLAFFSSVTSAGTGTIPRAEINMAATYFLRGEADKARAHLAKALAEQDNYQVRLCWAEMEVFRGSLDKAEELLGTVLLENPENPKALYLKRAAARIKARRAADKNRKRAADSRQRPG